MYIAAHAYTVKASRDRLCGLLPLEASVNALIRVLLFRVTWWTHRVGKVEDIVGEEITDPLKIVAFCFTRRVDQRGRVRSSNEIIDRPVEWSMRKAVSRDEVRKVSEVKMRGDQEVSLTILRNAKINGVE
jgi:hypothetical protein